MVLWSFRCQNWPQENIFLVNQPILMPNIQCVAVYWAIISPHFMKQYIQPLIRVNNYSDRYCDTLILILWPSFSCCLVQNSEMWKTLPWSNFTDFSPFKCLFRTTAMTWYWHWHWHWLTSIQIDDPQKIVPMDSICNSWNGFFGRLSVFVSFLWCTYLFLMFWMPVFFSLCTTFCPSKITSLIVQQAPRRSPQFWSHVVPLWSIQVQKWPGHVNYTSGTNSRSICTSSFHLKQCTIG